MAQKIKASKNTIEALKAEGLASWEDVMRETLNERLSTDVRIEAFNRLKNHPFVVLDRYATRIEILDEEERQELLSLIEDACDRARYNGTSPRQAAAWKRIGLQLREGV